MLNHRRLETISNKTLFGLRFWDPALNLQIKSGLHTTLHPFDKPEKKVLATCTKSCNYVFNNIPGLRAFETGLADIPDSAVSPPVSKPYVLEVRDTRQRFSDVALTVDLPLPYSGLFLTDDTSGSPADTPPGFNLYSAINRAPGPQYTVVRGELIDRNTQQAATNALVRVTTEDGFNWFGTSGLDGKFVVMMPYPFLNLPFNSSPPTSDGVRLFERIWPINVDVFYAPLSLVSLPGSQTPDYTSVLSQDQALIYTETPETDTGEVSVFETDLVYGRDLIIKTTGFSQLYISPTGSPA